MFDVNILRNSLVREQNHQFLYKTGEIFKVSALDMGMSDMVMLNITVFGLKLALTLISALSIAHIVDI